MILVGLFKGSFSDATGFVGVPLVISRVPAAAILLPILILMDVVSLCTWLNIFDRTIL